MKRVILLFATLVAVVIVASCGGSSSAKAEREKFVRDSIARADFVRDSIAREEFVKDSIAKEEKRAETIASLKPKFTEKKDEFSNTTWVEPVSAPKYRNRNGVYCYFAVENGKARNFRFVYQYYADDWLFIDNMIFNFDGELNVTIEPDMETDCSGGKIWEWCDEAVRAEGNNNLNEAFIVRLMLSKTVKVKMNGSKYYDTRTLTDAQIKAIKEAYDYFIALGGQFI